jgi:hypothetical protein
MNFKLMAYFRALRARHQIHTSSVPPNRTFLAILGRVLLSGACSHAAEAQQHLSRNCKKGV